MEQSVEPRPAVEHTRSALHGIAESLLTGPQHRATCEITVRITANGFGTTAGPHRELASLGLVNSQSTRIDAVGTFGEGASALDVILSPSDIGHPDGSKAQASDPSLLDHHEFRVVEEWLSDGALRILDPTQAPILWPEHLDVTVPLDGHSVGSSPGDEEYPRPDAYVNATHNDSSDCINVAFGALRDATDLTTAADLLALWREGLARIAAHDAIAEA